jgi:phage I-like protein
MSISNHPHIAVLASQTGPDPVAVLAYEIEVAADGWHQLLPAGFFKAVDGRPHDVPGGQWYLDATIAQRLIDQVQAAANDLVIDYEHQTLRKDENGQPAPAAGWFKDIEWRDGSGLWIKPRWTERAKSFVNNGEYRYLSAVFPYDATTGYPLKLHSAALTNRAGIDGMQALADLNASDLTPNHQEKAMNELLKQMLKALGITVTGEAALSEEDQGKALAALNELKTKAGTADSLATQVAELSAKDTTPDPAKYVPIEVVSDLQGQLAALNAQHETSELEKKLTDAKNDGRLLPSMEAWARELGKKDMAALSAFLDKATPLAALSQRQTDTTKVKEKEGPTAALSAEEKEAARLLGKTEDEFAAAKAKG